MENERLFRRVEVARHGELDFGAGLSKKEGFSSKKNAPIGHRAISLLSVCAAQSRTINSAAIFTF